MAETKVFAAMAVNITADTRGLNKGVYRAKKGVKNLGGAVKGQLGVFNQLNKVMGKLGFSMMEFGAIAGVAAARSMFHFAEAESEAVANTQKLARTLGTTTDNLRLFNRSGERANIPAEKMTASMKQFSRRMGEAKSGIGEALPFFNKLGIDLAAIGKKSTDPVEQAMLLADAINQLGDAQQRTAAFGKMFGEEAGFDIQRAFQKGNLTEARIDLERMGSGFDLVAANAEAFGDVQSTLSLAFKDLKQAWVGFAGPFLMKGMKALTVVANSLSKAVSGIVKAFKGFKGMLSMFKGVGKLSGTVGGRMVSNAAGAVDNLLGSPGQGLSGVAAAAVGSAPLQMMNAVNATANAEDRGRAARRRQLEATGNAPMEVSEGGGSR